MSLTEKRKQDLVSSSEFLEKNWLKNAERHYAKIEESSRDIRDILRISKNPKCKACQTRIRTAINEMHNEIESIRSIDPEVASFDEVLDKAKIRFMTAHGEAQKACFDMHKLVKNLKSTIVPYVVKIQRVVKTWQPVRMVLQNDRLHVVLSEFVQTENKRSRVILTLDVTGGRGGQKKQNAKKEHKTTFFTDVSSKSRKLSYTKNTFDFTLELNQRLRAHRGWHLLLLLMHPPPHRPKGKHHAHPAHPALCTAGMATVDLGFVAEQLLRGEECTLPIDFVRTPSSKGSAPAAAAVAAADQLVCRGKVTVHLAKQKELAAIRKHIAEVRDAVLKEQRTNQQEDPNVVKDQELQHRLDLLSDMYGGDTYDHVQSILQNYLRHVPRQVQHTASKSMAHGYISNYRKLDQLQRAVAMVPNAAIQRLAKLANEHVQGIALSVVRAVVLLLKASDLPATWIESQELLLQSGQNNVFRRIREIKEQVSPSVALMAQDELLFSVDLLRLRSDEPALANALVEQLDGDPAAPPGPQLVRAMQMHMGEAMEKLYCWAKQSCYCALTLHDASQKLIHEATREVHDRTVAFRKARGGMPAMHAAHGTFKEQMQQVEEDIKQSDFDKLIEEVTHA